MLINAGDAQLLDANYYRYAEGLTMTANRWLIDDPSESGEFRTLSVSKDCIPLEEIFIGKDAALTIDGIRK